MKAELLFHRKNVAANGDIVEMKLWKVPLSKDRPHGLKYSLVPIRDGRRLVGYDNAEVGATIATMASMSSGISSRM